MADIPERRKDDLGIGMLINAAERTATQSAELRDEVIALDEKLTLTNQVLRNVRLMTLGLLLGLVALVGLGVMNRVLLQNQKDQAESIKANTELIQSCTTPGGECQKRGADGTAKAVASIIDSNNNGKPDTQEILDAVSQR